MGKLEDSIKLTAKLYEMRDTARKLAKIAGKDYFESLKIYQEIIKGVMATHKINEIEALLKVAETETYKEYPVSAIKFMAATVELMEPSKPEQ